MPVDTTHADYDNAIDDWQKCRDVVNGEKSVKLAGETYLPKLVGMIAPDYEAYKMRALFYNATQRTIKGLAGAIFRKEPLVKFPGENADLIKKNIGSDGQSLTVLSQEATEEVLITARIGLLVDASDEESANVEPYVVLYYAENIINWRWKRIGREKVFTQIVLKEIVEENDPDDVYGVVSKTHYRVLLLDEKSGDTPFYRVEIYEDQTENADKPDVEKNFKKIKDIIPTKKGGARWDRIPLVMVTPIGVGSDLQKPPILDLVEVNLSHYRTSADLEHGRHYTALPTAWAAGFEVKTGEVLTIGSSRAWVTDVPTARCGFMEFTGSGLGSLRDAITEKERQMAVLGARLLDENKKEAEAADTVKLRHSGEQNTLSSIVVAVSEGMSKILMIIAEWLNLPTTDIVCKLNKDFDTAGMSAGMLISMLQSYQGGAMSFDVLFHNLKQGEIYPDDWTIEDERAAIESGAPMAPPGVTVPGSVPDPGGGAGNDNTAITSNVKKPE